MDNPIFANCIWAFFKDGAGFASDRVKNSYNVPTHSPTVSYKKKETGKGIQLIVTDLVGLKSKSVDKSLDIRIYFESDQADELSRVLSRFYTSKPFQPSKTNFPYTPGLNPEAKVLTNYCLGKIKYSLIVEDEMIEPTDTEWLSVWTYYNGESAKVARDYEVVLFVSTENAEVKFEGEKGWLHINNSWPVSRPGLSPVTLILEISDTLSEKLVFALEKSALFAKSFRDSPSDKSTTFDLVEF